MICTFGALREKFIRMKENVLVDFSKEFAVKIVRVCRILREERNEKIMSSQLLRSGTSIGANIHEGNYASSRLDFINKFQIAMKECYETEYWMEILVKTEYLEENEYTRLHADCSKIRKLLTASITTAKQKL